MFENLRLLLIARRLKKCKVTTKCNAQLREIKVVYEGKPVKVLDFIDKVAETLPKVMVDGKDLDHEKRMKDTFYKHGLKGLNLYLDYVRLRTKIEKKKLNLTIKK